MKRIVLACLLALVCAPVSFGAAPAKPVTVEVLYMNHGPLQDTLQRMKKLFAGYGAGIRVAWHDFESRDGEDFKAKKGISQHVPLMIWINGSTEAKAGGKVVSFEGFPSGSGPMFFQGKWTLDDLKAALDRAVAGK